MLKRFARWLTAKFRGATDTDAAVGPQSAIEGSQYLKQRADAVGVLVFVHGVIGDALTTWTNKETRESFPGMVAKDPECDAYDVFVFGYPTRATGKQFTIDDVAEHLRLVLDEHRVTHYERMAFVVHSMGGLVTRTYVHRYQHIVRDKIDFLYFLSTPTSGADIANYAALISNNRQFADMRPMRTAKASWLEALHKNWLAAHFAFPSYCAYERRDTFGMRIVSFDSAIQLCTESPNPIDADHINMVKPASRDDAAYIAVRQAVRTHGSPARPTRPEMTGTALTTQGAPTTKKARTETAQMHEVGALPIGASPMPASAADADWQTLGEYIRTNTDADHWVTNIAPLVDKMRVRLAHGDAILLHDTITHLSGAEPRLTWIAFQILRAARDTPIAAKTLAELQTRASTGPNAQFFARALQHFLGNAPVADLQAFYALHARDICDIRQRHARIVTRRSGTATQTIYGEDLSFDDVYQGLQTPTSTPPSTAAG